MQTKTTKRRRQQEIVEILKRNGAASQEDLVNGLAAVGMAATQATVSRDLRELGAVKQEGRYRLPVLESEEEGWRLDFDTAGENLVVLKTDPGQANVLALRIDGARIPEIVGTVAGDDTIFVAVKGRQEQSRALRKILDLLK